MCDDERLQRIRALNDGLRTTGVGGKMLMTRGVSSLPQSDLTALIAAVREFSDFSPDNDPHAEHDFGMVQIRCVTAFWKIDYYDLECCLGAEDPSDPDNCTRVLTIMLADEY